MQVLDIKDYGGEGGIRTLGTGISQYNGLANLSFDAVPIGFNGLQSDYLTLVGPDPVSCGNFCSPLCSPLSPTPSATDMAQSPDRSPFVGLRGRFTHHEREPLVMEGGTTFYFVTGGSLDLFRRSRRYDSAR
jgi:hypothetical protein